MPQTPFQARTEAAINQIKVSEALCQRQSFVKCLSDGDGQNQISTSCLPGAADGPGAYIQDYWIHQLRIYVVDPASGPAKVSSNNHSTVRIAQTFRSNRLTIYRLPLPEEVPMAFRVLPEYFLEDVVDYFLFIVR